MKDRSTNETANRLHSVASDVAVSGIKSKPSYQIDDRRAVSVMQRKFRNLANGLASANIIQQTENLPNLESKMKPFKQSSNESE